MCEKRGMCTGKRQVPLLVVTTLLVGVRPELVGEYKLIYRDKKGCRCKYLNGANDLCRYFNFFRFVRRQRTKCTECRGFESRID